MIADMRVLRSMRLMRHSLPVVAVVLARSTA